MEQPQITDAYDVNVEVDGQAAKVDWPHADTAEGLSEVEYELTFIQCLPNGDELDRHVMHLEILPRPAKEEDRIRAVIPDLRTDVHYLVSIAVRYPRIGPRPFEHALKSLNPFFSSGVLTVFFRFSQGHNGVT